MTTDSRRPDAAGPDSDASDPTAPETFGTLLDLDAAPEPLAPPRDHHVTAVLVSHDGARWLPASLTTLARATRPPDVLMAVDTGSTDDSVALLTAALGADAVVPMPRHTGFGAAVAAGLVAADRTRPAHGDGEPGASADAEVAQGDSAEGDSAQGGADGPVHWVWLLHDDCAPAPDALAALLAMSDTVPGAAVLGPKVRGWHDRRLLVECGLTVTGSGRRETGLERGESDQGQHDGLRDVLAVGSAGLLVRREVWDSLGGFDPRLPLFRDDLDFGWRAHAAGHRVLVATDAVVHHAEAGSHGRRPLDAVDSSPAKADREAALYSSLVHARGLAVPFVLLRAVVGTLLRALGLLLAKSPGEALDELAALGSVLVRPGRIVAGRRSFAAVRTLPNSELAHLRPRPGSQLRHGLEALGGTLAGGRADDTTRAALETGPGEDDADFDGDDSRWLRVLRRPGVLLTLALLGVGLLGVRAWFGNGRLQGGALLPAPDGAGDLWATYAQGWHEVAMGAATPAPPYLGALAAWSGVLLGSATRGVDWLLMLTVPMAGLSAFLAMRGVVKGRGLRLIAATAYALLPGVVSGVASGRLGTAAFAVLLPPLLRLAVVVPVRWRAAWAGSLLLALTTAFAPVAWPVAVVLAVVAALTVARSREGALRLLAFVALPVLLLLPWSWYVAHNPVLLLLEPGLPGPTDPTLAPWQVLLLHPGGPAMTPTWLSAGLVVAGLVAMLRITTRAQVTAVWVLGVVALAVGVVQSVITVVPPTSTTAVSPWPGPATAMLGAAVILAAALGADGVWGRLGAQSFGSAQLVAVALLVSVVLAPVVSAVLFAWHGVGPTVSRSDATPVPAYVAADAASADLPRALVLRGTRDGIDYALVSGTDLQLGDAETGPPGASYTDLDALVAALVSGRAGGEVTALGQYAVRYVVLARPANPAVAAVLDSVPGLRRLSSSDGDTLWRLAPLSSRVRVAPGAARPAPRPAPRAVPAQLVDGATSVDATLPPGTTAGDLLLLAESADPGWSATATSADGTSTVLPAASPGDWRAGFVLPPPGARVTAGFDQGPRSRWLWWQGLLLLAVIVLALPGRTREAVDPDVDVAGEDEPVRPDTTGAVALRPRPVYTASDDADSDADHAAPGTTPAAAPEADPPSPAGWTPTSPEPDDPVPAEAAPDEAVPDTAVPDTAVPDEAVPDEAVPDEAVPADLPTPPDSSTTQPGGAS